MTAVTGASPVTFISEDTEAGVQLQIPLVLLKITNGAVDPSSWGPSASLGTNDGKLLTALLADLLARGVIRAVD